MLNDSKLYSFLDNQNSFTIHFFEGQKLIHDIALLHNLTGAGFSYYRDLLLCIAPLVSFLKKGESFGFYLDSEKPYFRFKVETNYMGNLRTLMLPSDFNEFPEKITGIVRFSKLFNNASPYTTVLKIEDKTFQEVVNQLLHDSYQIECSVQVSDIADQSIMIGKIPRENVGRLIIDPGMNHKDYLKKFLPQLSAIFGENLTDEKAIINYFEEKKLYYLGEKPFRLFCPCSKERMRENLAMLSEDDVNEIFKHDPTLDIQCDYCHKKYHFKQEELKPN